MRFLSPNYAEYWSACPAWPTMAARYPGEESDPTSRLEGRAIHDIAAKLLMGVPFQEFVPGQEHCGIVIDQTMIDIASSYGENVIKSWSTTCFHRTECPLDCLITKGKAVVDHFAFFPDTETLTVWELKGGKRPVKVKENKQMLCYANTLIPLIGRRVRHVEFIIDQPRAYDDLPRLRRWVTTPGEIAPMLQELYAAAEAARLDVPVTSTGPVCRKCPGRAVCESRRANVNDGFHYLEAPMMITEPTQEQLAEEMVSLAHYIDIMATRLSGLEALAKVRNEYLPGFEWKEGRGGVEWAKPRDEIVALGELFGKDLRGKKPLTPKQAIAAGIPEPVVMANAKKTPGKMTLKPVDISKAKEYFKNG